MPRNNITKGLVLLSILTIVSVITNSCKKSFLDTKTQGTLDENTLSDAKGVDKLLVGSYAMLDLYEPAYNFNQFFVSASNMLFGTIGGAESNKGSEQADQGDNVTPVLRHETNPLNISVADEWRGIYEAVHRCNETLRVLSKVTVIADADKVNFEGQARFLRAWYHFLGRIVFKKVPWIDVAIDDQLASGEIKGVTNQDEILPKILEDAKFAYENLPEAQSGVGRVNKWVAGAFYGKVLMFNHDFTTAKTVLQDVVSNGKNPKGVKFDLIANYADNFDFSKENSAESVFAFQATAKDNAGAGNSNWGDVLYTPPNAGGGAGFLTPTYFFVNKFKTDAAGLPVANPDNKNVIDPYDQVGYTKYTGNVDPRLDWTVGRDGVPYLDWGLVDHTWVRPDPNVSAPFSSGPFQPKKQTIRNAQVGDAHDVSVWFPAGGTALNVNLIRFSDVLLLLAEAEAEAGTLTNAWTLVNRVRARAATTGTVKTYIDNTNPAGGFTNTDAGLYKAAPYPVVFATKDDALKAVRLERTLELGMEGHRFFDLVRWGISEQELNSFYQYESQFPYAKILQVPTVPSYQAATDDYYPVPQKQIDRGFGFTLP